MIDIGKLHEFQAFIFEEHLSSCYKGKFPDLALLRISGPVQAGAKTIHNQCRRISEDLNKIALICYRLDHTRRLSIEAEEFEGLWYSYASLDIEHFFLTFRSLLDHIAPIIAALSQRPDQLPKDSLNDLLKWLRKNERRASSLLGQTLIDLLARLDWIDDIRRPRVDLTHRGAQVMTFGSQSEGIHFWIHDQKYHKKIEPKGALYRLLVRNENLVINFDCFAALYFSNFLCWIEDLADIIHGKLTIEYSNIKGVSHCNKGFGILKNWATKAIEISKRD